MTYNRLAVLLTKYRTIVDFERQIECHQITPLMQDLPHLVLDTFVHIYGNI